MPSSVARRRQGSQGQDRRQGEGRPAGADRRRVGAGRGAQDAGLKRRPAARSRSGGAKAPLPQQTSGGQGHEELAGAEPPPGEEISESQQRSAVQGRRYHARRAAPGGGAGRRGSGQSTAGASQRPCRAVHAPLRARARRRHHRRRGHRPWRARVDRRRAGDTRGASSRRRRSAWRATPLPDFSQWGEVERAAAAHRSARNTAERMARGVGDRSRTSRSATRPTSPSSRSSARSTRRRPEAAGGKLTITAIALKVIAAALKTFPQFNASIDVAGEAIVMKKYVHIGVAVDTDRGLLVPVIRDVDQKNIVAAVGGAGRSSPRRPRPASSQPAEMQGGSFTISNLGGIGGTYFTPIINAPEVAILGMSRSVDRAGVDGRGVRAAADDAAVAVLRPPRDRRRRRHPLPALGVRGVRAAASLMSLGSGLTGPLPELDLVVIGAGPGGYAAAFYAADRGLQRRAHRSRAEPGRRLRLPRLHPVEGAAARRQGDRRSRARRRRGASPSASRRSTSTSCARFKDNVVDAAHQRHRPAREGAQDQVPPRHAPRSRARPASMWRCSRAAPSR